MGNRKNIVWIFGFILLGIAVVFLGMKFKSHPEKIETSEFSSKAKIISVPKLKLNITASGFGLVKAADKWDAVAEVSGRVVYKSEKLKDGEFIHQSEELLTIDPSSYELSLAQIKAQIQSSLIKDETTRLSIKNRSEEVALLEKEYQRQKKLADRGNVSQSVLDTTQRNLLTARSNLLSLENSLKINQAEREVMKIQREQAQQDLQKTHLIAPLNARVTEVMISSSQYANKGQKLFSADCIDAVEIEVQFPVGKLRPLVMSSLDPVRKPSNDWVPGVIGLPATVSLQHSDNQSEWPATISRVSASINPQTQTLGIVARVDNPYASAESGKKPPLISDLFVEVEIHGQNTSKFVVIPDSAIHEGKVYVMNDDNRLEIRTVKIGFRQKGYVVIKKGLKPKDKVVTSDLVPAIQGMLLTPVKDNKTMKQLLLDALGEIPPEFKEKMSQDKKRN